MPRHTTHTHGADVTGYGRINPTDTEQSRRNQGQPGLFRACSVLTEETTTESGQDCAADYFDWQPGADGCSDVLDLDVDQVLSAAAAENEAASNEEIAFRHSGWAPLRAYTRTALVGAGANDRRLAAFDSCGCNARVWKNKTTGQVKIRSFLCHDRLCVPCANARAQVIKGNLRKKLATVPFKHLTLTLKSNDTPLFDQRKRAMACFGALRGTAVWKENVRGGAAFFETTFNKATKRFHPHLHVIVQARYVPHEQLAPAWRKITGDSDVVWISPYTTSEQAIEDVGKYASKPMHKSLRDDPDAAAEFVRSLWRQRLVNCFGCWRGLHLLDPLDKIDKEQWQPAERLADVLAAVRREEPWALALLAACCRQKLWLKSIPPPSE